MLAMNGFGFTNGVRNWNTMSAMHSFKVCAQVLQVLQLNRFATGIPWTETLARVERLLWVRM